MVGKWWVIGLPLFAAPGGALQTQKGPTHGDPLQKVARAVKTAMGADGVMVMQFNEAPAGQTIFRLHVYVLPGYSGVEWAPHAGARAEPQVSAAEAARVRAALET